MMTYEEFLVKKLPKLVINRFFVVSRYGPSLGRAWTNLAEILGHDSGMVLLHFLFKSH